MALQEPAHAAGHLPQAAAPRGQRADVPGTGRHAADLLHPHPLHPARPRLQPHPVGTVHVAIAVTIAVTASTLGGRALSRYGVRATAAAGIAFMLVGVALYLRIDVDGSFLAGMLAPELLTGFGFGLMVAPAAVAATAEASPSEAGLASGLVNVSQQTGISIGMAVLISLAAATTGGSTQPADLVSGHHTAVWTAVAILATALVAALALLPKRAPVVAEQARAHQMA
ncbi:MFS transporter [Nonomuraea sp. NPDC059194]|uniref:MFS transporter n=1 Tax=Nonomuraea sp. NPDC059194 TaxID=3346764 RepID=UPI0036CC1DA5